MKRLFLILTLGLTLLTIACGGSENGNAVGVNAEATSTRAAEQTEVAKAREDKERPTESPSVATEPPTPTAMPEPSPTVTARPTRTPRPSPTPVALTDDDFRGLLIDDADLPDYFELAAEGALEERNSLNRVGYSDGLSRRFDASPSPSEGLWRIHSACANYRSRGEAKRVVNEAQAYYLDNVPDYQLVAVDVTPIGMETLAATGTVSIEGGEMNPLAVVWVVSRTTVCEYYGIAQNGNALEELVSILTAAPAIAAVIPTPTPQPPAPMSAFLPTLEDFGLPYEINDSERITEVPGMSGFLEGDSISYAVTPASFGIAPLLVYGECVRFSTPDLASDWIERERDSQRSRRSNVQADQAIDLGIDEAYSLTGLLQQYQQTYIWFRIGATSCEYSSQDEDSNYYQFVVNLANRVIERMRPA